MRWIRVATFEEINKWGAERCKEMRLLPPMGGGVTASDSVSVSDSAASTSSFHRTANDSVGSVKDDGLPNWFPDPSFERDTVGSAPTSSLWAQFKQGTSAFTTFAVQAADAISGSKSFHMVGSVDAGGGMQIGAQAGYNVSTYFPIKFGTFILGSSWTAHTLPVSVYLKLSWQSFPSGNVGHAYASIGWFDGSVPQIANGGLLTLTGAAATTDTTMTVWFTVENWAGTAQNFDIAIDAIGIFEGSTWPGYGDGNLPGWIWSGTPGLSPSIPVGAAVSKRGYVRNASDSIATISDSASRNSISFSRPTADSISVSDSSSGNAAKSRLASDAVSVSDTDTRVLNNARSAVDSMSLNDAATRSVVSVRSLFDSLNISDSPAPVTSQSRSSFDAISVSDSSQNLVMGQRSASDSLSISDSPNVVTAFSRTAIDSIALSDIATRSVISFGRIATESWTVSDSAGGIGRKPRSISDSWTVSDSGHMAARHPTWVAETIRVFDSAKITQAIDIAGLRAVLVATPLASASITVSIEPTI